MKKNDVINCTIAGILDTKFKPEQIFNIDRNDPTSRIITIPAHHRYTVTVEGITHINGDVVEIHNQSDYQHIQYLEKRLASIEQKFAGLLEMNRNYIKYDMPASKEIMRSRLIRQYGVTELLDLEIPEYE